YEIRNYGDVSRALSVHDNLWIDSNSSLGPVMLNGMPFTSFELKDGWLLDFHLSVVPGAHDVLEYTVTYSWTSTPDQ
ncbi:MAG: hypothetical protein JNK53_02040, partial [Phycisphaerae bacterium]|nr:hypothetical protein [Phycisphaerae bacterium]